MAVKLWLVYVFIWQQGTGTLVSVTDQCKLLLKQYAVLIELPLVTQTNDLKIQISCFPNEMCRFWRSAF